MQLDAWEIALGRVRAGRDAQSIVLHRLRGEGKTVMLGRFARMARQETWLVLPRIDSGAALLE